MDETQQNPALPPEDGGAHKPEQALIDQRKAKLAALRAKGIDPFKNKFTPAETCAQARANYAEGREVALAGRITAHRDMGKSMFLDIRDQSGRIQVYAQKNVLGDEQFDIFKHLDLGDFLGVRIEPVAPHAGRGVASEVISPTIIPRSDLQRERPWGREPRGRRT